MVKSLLAVLLSAIPFICLILVPSGVLASRSMLVSTDKNSLFGFEEMLIIASPSGFASDEAIFVKGAFFKEGSTNYFGYTKFADRWIKNSETTIKQMQIKINQWDKLKLWKDSKP